MKHRALYLLLLWPATCLLVIWYTPGCAPFEDLEQTSGNLPAAARCGDCHAAVYEEWRLSPHSRAFTSPEFLARTDGGTVERCVTCHAPAPAPVGLVRPPTARLEAREEGVTCISCHRIAPNHGSPASPSMAGPLARDALVQPHAIESLEAWFRDAALCGRCHEDSYAEWKVASTSDTPTCQGCHMPSVVRKVTQATGFVSEMLVAFEEEHELRAHDFSAAAALDETAKVLDDAFLTLHESRSAGERILRLENRLPHSMPTGGFGRHRIHVSVLRDQDIILERVLRSQSGALKPGERVELRIPEEAGPTLRIEVTRQVILPGGVLEELPIWTRELQDEQLPLSIEASVVVQDAPSEVSP